MAIFREANFRVATFREAIFQEANFRIPSKVAVRIFKRSQNIYNVRYKTYIGDGDSSSFQSVVDAKPYKDLTPVKAECTGHIQKRVGSRLRRLKGNTKGNLSDGIPLGGAGWLTLKVINTLQNAMGIAIRQNIGSLYPVKKSIGALFNK